MRYFLIFLFSALLISCTQELPTDKTVEQIPERLLDEQEFTNMYYDAQLIESVVRLEVGKGADSKEVSLYLYDQLFKKYGITEADFKTNIRYYASDPQKMQKIQTEVVNRLTKKEASLTNQ